MISKERYKKTKSGSFPILLILRTWTQAKKTRKAVKSLELTSMQGMREYDP